MDESIQWSGSLPSIANGGINSPLLGVGTSGSGSSGGGRGANAIPIIGTILTGAAGIISAFNPATQNTTINQAPSSKGGNTVLYVIVGVVALLAIFALARTKK